MRESHRLRRMRKGLCIVFLLLVLQEQELNITTDIGAMVKLVKQAKDYSLCSWVWNFYAGAGEEDGSTVGWSDCRICNCEVVCTVWQGLCALCERVCEIYERCCNGILGIKKGRAETYFISCAVSEPKNF